MSRLRRIACMKWLPPIDRASPSPVITQTLKSGFAHLIPAHRRSAAMDAVEPIRIHVVREPGRAANAGHENDSFARDAEFGHHLLYVVEDCIVPATRTPAYFLIGNEISLLQLSRWWRTLPETANRLQCLPKPPQLWVCCCCRCDHYH